VDGSAQNCTTLLIEFCELVDGVFEIANAADRFQLLKLSVTRRAFPSCHRCTTVPERAVR
jgi:hypothetical protein